jgi:hypothetical protein
VVEEATVGGFKAGTRTAIMRKGMPKLAKEIFAIYIIPSIHRA